MNNRLIIGFLICTVLATSCSKPQTTHALPPVNALASGQSANWRVDILSAKKQRDYSAASADPLKPKVYYIELKMRVQYLGPSGSINPPISFFNVATPEGKTTEQKYGPVGMTFDQDPENLRLATWLFKGQPAPAGELKQPGPDTATTLETGKHFQVIIHYPYPDWIWSKKEFRLEFGDIPSITFTVSPGERQ